MLAAVALAVGTAGGRPASASARTEAWAIRSVACHLGTTPAVCRSSDVDPRIVDHYRNGTTIGAVLPDLGRGTELGQLSIQGAAEEAVLALLDP